MKECCAKFIDIFDDLEVLENCLTCKTKAEENKMTVEITNHNLTVCRIEVDNCLIKDKNIKKCDFVFWISNNTIEKYFFVELKRPNKTEKLNDAFEQIKNTVSFFTDNIEIERNKITGIIVNRSIPKSSPSINKLKTKFKNIGKKLIFASKHYAINEI